MLQSEWMLLKENHIFGVHVVKVEINLSDNPRISMSFDASLVTDDPNYTRFKGPR